MHLYDSEGMLLAAARLRDCRSMPDDILMMTFSIFDKYERYGHEDLTNVELSPESVATDDACRLAYSNLRAELFRRGISVERVRRTSEMMRDIFRGLEDR